MAVGFALLTWLAFSPEPNSASDHYKQGANDGQPSVIPSDTPPEKSTGKADCAKSEGNPPPINTPIEGAAHWWAKSEWWVLVVAGLTGLVISWQSWETRKAAEAGIKSLDVALVSARAIVTAERAWLIALMDNPPLPPDGPYMFAGIPKLINHGNTPAFVYEIGNGVAMIGKGEVLPPIPLYDNKNVANFGGRGIAIAPKGEFGRAIMSDGTVPAADVLHGRSVVWVYGYVKYKTVSSSETMKETRYCFRLIPAALYVLPNIFAVDGPSSYNEAI